MNSPDKLLEKHSLRKTSLRLKVLTKFLDRPHAAVSTQNLEKSLADADRISLYRTLKTFEKVGLIHKVMDGTQQNKYAICEENCGDHRHDLDHAHFHCDMCKNTYCLEELGLDKISLPPQYTLHKANLALSGICANCK